MDMLEGIELSAIFNSVSTPVFIKNEQLQFIFINKAYTNMFNIKPRQILGKTVLEVDYLPEEDRIFYQAEDAEMLRTGKTGHHIFTYLYKGKEMHTCLYWTSGFVQKNGRRGLIGNIVDINRQRTQIERLRKRLKVLNAEKEKFAQKNRVDALTNLYGRGAFDEALQKLASAPENDFSCIMLDIDHFKLVNDTFGHIEGDAVLKSLAVNLKKYARKHDIVCRYGGEEFVVLLPESGLDDAVQVAERIRNGVCKNVHTPDGKSVTISAGCSEWKAGEPGTLVVQRADKALYTAKQSGRNRVCTV